MLYVDGMNAVIEQNEVVQWLYSLVDSSVRVVTFTNFSWEKSVCYAVSSFDLL